MIETEQDAKTMAAGLPTDPVIAPPAEPPTEPPTEPMTELMTAPSVTWQARLKKLSGGRESWAIADQALVSGTNFLTNVIVARSLGLKQFGVFAMAWLAVLFLSSLQMASIIAPMMSLAPKTPQEDRPGFFGALIVQEAAYTLISIVLLLSGLHFIALWSHQPALVQLAWPLSAAVVAYLLQDFVRRYFFATKQSRRAFIDDAISCLPQLPLIWFLARAHVIGTPGVLLIIALTSLVGVLLGAYWLEPLALTRTAFRATTRRQWKISRWLTPSALLTWTASNFFVVIAPAYYGAVAAGVLRASQNMVGVAHIWFLGLDNVVPAETARRLHEQGVAAAKRYLRSMAVRWGGLTGIFIAVLCVAPSLWLKLIYGPKYAGYGYLLRLFGLLYLVLFIGKMVNAGLQALEYTSPIFWLNLAMTATSLVIAVPLTKHLGLAGVMIGTIGTQVVMQSALLIALLIKLRGMGPSFRPEKVQAR